MENYIVQNRTSILDITSEIEEARRVANDNKGSEFYLVRREIADCARTLTDLGIPCRYTPQKLVSKKIMPQKLGLIL
ncbi:MAG: hypothetical protein AABX73_04525 [Nanoarchaeota archaeon]